MPTIEELAEDTLAYLPTSPMFEPVEADGCVHVFGRHILWVVRVRHIDLEAVRAAARARNVPRIEWWLGPSSPPAPKELAPDETPLLTGMTCSAPPPEVPGVEVRRAGVAEVAEVEHAVWGGEARPPREEHPTIHHFAAEIDGRVAGVGRAVDLDDGVALMGGAVRALVRARWDHAVARGTPLLVVQAGALSEPVLARLGFRAHCELHLFVAPGVASGHGDN